MVFLVALLASIHMSSSCVLGMVGGHRQTRAQQSISALLRAGTALMVPAVPYSTLQQYYTVGASGTGTIPTDG